MFDDLWDMIQSLAAFRSRVVRLSGPEHHSQQDLTVVYVGNGKNLAFVSRSIFGDQAVETEIGKCNIWGAAAQADIHASNADMIVVDVPWPYDITMPCDERVIEIPAWVRQETQLMDTWTGVIKGLRKSVRDSQLRKIRKFDLTQTTTQDPIEVDRFYDTMYEPHLRRRFGVDATFASRQLVQKCVSAGTLLKILRDGEVIGACVLLDLGETLQLLFVGFSAKDLREIDGASAGIYYYSLEYAFQNGYKNVDFCGSRPFLNDGVLAVKRRWGAGVFHDWSLEHLLIQLNELSPGVESFLSNHPVITCQGDRLIGKVLISDRVLTADVANKLSHRFVSAGIDGLNIYSLRGIQSDAYDVVKSGSVPVQLIDLCDSGDPLRSYCG